MTRTEIIESLTGFPENKLHVGNDGIVKVSRFIDWLKSFMPNGSGDKTAICDVESIQAIAELAATEQHGFRWAGEKLETPYGFISVLCDASADGITVIEPSAEAIIPQRAAFACSQGISETILKIAA